MFIKYFLHGKNAILPSCGSCHLKLSFGKPSYIWGVAAWEIAHLWSYHLGNCHVGSGPWEKYLIPK